MIYVCKNRYFSFLTLPFVAITTVISPLGKFRSEVQGLARGWFKPHKMMQSINREVLTELRVCGERGWLEYRS